MDHPSSPWGKMSKNMPLMKIQYFPGAGNHPGPGLASAGVLSYQYNVRKNPPRATSRREPSIQRMNFGKFKISAPNLGLYRLDGGAMFGTVPKNIWSGLIAPDTENCIPLVTRALLIDAGERLFLADVGSGDKWPEKLRRIYAIRHFSPKETGIEPMAVTDIIISHLHFDHGGGISRYRSGSRTEVELCFPRARVYLQEDNYRTARNPNPRERASYLSDNVRVLNQANLRLTHGSQEIHPGLWVHQSNGHTRVLQWLEVRNGTESVVFPSDVIPTSRHLPLPFLMGYDMSAETLLLEKEDFLNRAVAGQWIVVFCHDPDVPAGRITVNDKGHFTLAEQVAL
jgi:glyoxylase-like metal-dependent hydrolase (beta-lactamase superfamily II)